MHKRKCVASEGSLGYGPDRNLPESSVFSLCSSTLGHRSAIASLSTKNIIPEADINGVLSVTAFEAAEFVQKPEAFFLLPIIPWD